MNEVDIDEFLGQPPRTRWRRWRKWVFIGVPVLIVLLLLARCFRPAPPVQYATAPVERHDLDVTITATGNLAPTVQVNVGSEESGLVDKVYVQNNDHVVKGQPLAQLDLSRLRDALVQSQATLAGGARDRRAEPRDRRPDQGQSGARGSRSTSCPAGRCRRRPRLDTARADYARAVANVAQAQAQVAQARANVSTNRTNLAKGTIYAPVTGVVLSRQVEPGQTVAASFNVATLFTIAQDLSKMKLQVKVDEADVGELHPGASATFTVDAYPEPDLPGDGDAGRSRRQCDTHRQQRRHDPDGDHQRGRLHRGAGGLQSRTDC